MSTPDTNSLLAIEENDEHDCHSGFTHSSFFGQGDTAEFIRNFDAFFPGCIKKINTFESDFPNSTQNLMGGPVTIRPNLTNAQGGGSHRARSAGARCDIL